MSTPHQNIDRVGGLLSLVCAIHCAAVPVLVVAAALGMPVADQLLALEDERVELGFSLAAVVFVTISVGLGWRQAKRGPMLAGFAVGLALLVGSRLVPGPEWVAHLALVAGALTLALTHRRSFQAGASGLRGDACCDDAPAPAALLP